MSKIEIYEGYFNDSDALMNSDDIVSDVESKVMSDTVKYNYSLKVEIRINGSHFFDNEQAVAKVMKMFISKCTFDLDNLSFIEEVGDFYIEQNAENGVYDPGPNDYKLSFGGFDIACNEETYKKGKLYAFSNLYRLWCTIPIVADIKNARQVYRLFKYFYCASPFWKHSAKFFNCFEIIDNRTKEFAIVSLDYDGHKQSYDFKRFGTISEELFGLCLSNALFGESYKYSQLLNDMRTNDADWIFCNQYFSNDDYFFESDETHNGDIKYLGHFDKLRPCSNPNSYAYNKYPVCSYGQLFLSFGQLECTPSVDFNKANYRYSWICQYCLKHGYSAYYVLPEDSEEGEKVVLIFDGMAENQGNEYSVVLVGDVNSGYTKNGLIDILSCVMPYETAQDVIKENTKTTEEDEEDY